MFTLLTSTRIIDRSALHGDVAARSNASKIRNLAYDFTDV
jgi:hypothetical protein